MDAFYLKYSQKLTESSAPGYNGQCQIWTGLCTPNGKYGVINCKFPDARGRRQMHVHRLAYMVPHQNIIIDKTDVSHLCHNSKCITVEHHGFNNSRQSCVSTSSCLGHPDPLPPCRVELKMDNNNLGKMIIGYFYIFILLLFFLGRAKKYILLSEWGKKGKEIWKLLYNNFRFFF